MSSWVGRWFPSPIGELHFSMVSSMRFASSHAVSVPYRGATFLNEDEEDDEPEWTEEGFRPLSGSYISQ